MDTMVLDFDGTPPWLADRCLRVQKPPMAHACTAAFLLQRAQQCVNKLHTPDAWVCPVTRRLWYTPAAAAAAWERLECPEQPLALRVGDKVTYSQVLHLPFVTHDMVYCGLGCVVGLARHGDAVTQAEGMDPSLHAAASGFKGGGRVMLHQPRIPCSAIVLERLDLMTVQGKRIGAAPALGDNARRLNVLRRAVLSLGYYRYDALTFNCQHVHARMEDRAWKSIGLRRCVALYTFTALCLLGALLASVWALLETQRKKSGGSSKI